MKCDPRDRSDFGPWDEEQGAGSQHAMRGRRGGRTGAELLGTGWSAPTVLLEVWCSGACPNSAAPQESFFLEFLSKNAGVGVPFPPGDLPDRGSSQCLLHLVLLTRRFFTC